MAHLLQNEPLIYGRNGTLLERIFDGWIKCIARGYQIYLAGGNTYQTAHSHASRKGLIIKALIGGQIAIKDNIYTHDVVIPANIVEATHMSEEELLVAVAIYLYTQQHLTLEQASMLAHMHRLDFQRQLADRGLNVHFSVDDFNEDLATLKSLGRLGFLSAMRL